MCRSSLNLFLHLYLRLPLQLQLQLRLKVEVELFELGLEYVYTFATLLERQHRRQRKRLCLNWKQQECRCRCHFHTHLHFSSRCSLISSSHIVYRDSSAPSSWIQIDYPQQQTRDNSTLQVRASYIQKKPSRQIKWIVYNQESSESCLKWDSLPLELSLSLSFSL